MPAGRVRGHVRADGCGAQCERAAALREVSALIDGGIQPPMILGQLRAAAIRLRPDARVKSGLEAVFRTDLAIKSSAGTPQYLLECLVVELCAR